MPQSAKSIFVFGIYLIGLGSGFIVAPNLLLSLFGIPPTSEVWIRIVGMLLLFLGIYDLVVAKNNLRPFIACSVPIRFSVILFFIAFFALGLAPPILILFGVIDFAFAAWTWSALRKESITSASTVA